MNTESIKTIKDFKSLAHFLAEELSWPIDPDNVDVDDLVFEYQPEDIGLSDEFAAKVQAIKQIRPLDANQPWSIFWIDFENKKLPLTVLRRILNAFVTKKRGNSRNIATKEMEDIMFVSGHGEDRNRAITFAHFKRLDDVETIREFYWDGHETKFDHIASYLEKLEWPNNTADIEGWRKKWKAAFTGSTREAITTSDQLAQAMANIAKNIRDRVLEVLHIEPQSGPVHKLYDTFRSGLVHDMTEKGFADMYAQTITYGLFSARTMDTDGHFELHEVIDLIPTTNPFLKNLFKECLSTGDKNQKIDLDELGVGRLVDLFDNLNKSDGTDSMQRILAEFGRQTLSGQEDPVIHFYEGFLKEYDSIQRIKQGVYYTPDPVVKFIVKSVHAQLKTEFGLENGLADTTTWAEMVSSGRAEYPVDPNTNKTNKDWIDKIKGRSFVQILDFATGTGTFLKYVLETIHEEVKYKFKHENISGDWNQYWNEYVYNNLLPRVYGFELMMASYTVAHMKLGMYLKSTGYNFEKDQRLNIFLTNSLEPFNSKNIADLFYSSIGAESIGANTVKKDRLFSVIIGNPPYSKLSGNLSSEVRATIEKYKFLEGKKIKEKSALQFEMNLQDDYVKFIRFAEMQIERNGLGITALISNNGYFRNPTLRGMRFSLQNTFNSLNFINLHRDGTEINEGEDENVFDIVQEVGIGFLIKNKKDKVANYTKIIGNREYKYLTLNNSIYTDLNYSTITFSSPYYNFINEDFVNRGEFNTWEPLDSIFLKNGAGILTSRDSLVIDFKRESLLKKLHSFINHSGSDEEIFKEFAFEDSARFQLRPALNQLKKKINQIDKEIYPISYRPFDNRYIFYDSTLVWSMSNPTMKHVLELDNLCLISTRQVTKGLFEHAFVTRNLSELKLCSHNRSSQIFPLFVSVNGKKELNVKPKFLAWFNDLYDSKVNDEKKGLDIFHYIYGILYSNWYRMNYSVFLKSEFARIPRPKNLETYLKLVSMGEKLAKLHLLEFDFPLVTIPNQNDRIVNDVKLKENNVFINKTNNIASVTNEVWNFGIGGYKPAQKWLKSFKGKELSDENINLYRKIVYSLAQTIEIMKEIDMINILGDNATVQYLQDEDDYQIAADSGN